METIHTFTYENRGITHTIAMKTPFIDTDIEEVLNLMRQYLLILGYTDDTARRLRVADEVDEDTQIHTGVKG